MIFSIELIKYLFFFPFLCQVRSSSSVPPVAVASDFIKSEETRFFSVKEKHFEKKTKYVLEKPRDGFQKSLYTQIKMMMMKMMGFDPMGSMPVRHLFAQSTRISNI